MKMNTTVAITSSIAVHTTPAMIPVATELVSFSFVLFMPVIYQN